MTMRYALVLLPFLVWNCAGEPGAVDEPEARGESIEEQALGHAQRADQVQLLHHDAHAGITRVGPACRSEGLPLEAHRAGVGRDDARDDARFGRRRRSAGRGSEMSTPSPNIDAELEKALAEEGPISRKVPLEQILREGDRVEIYRPLIADPKEARRARANVSRTVSIAGLSPADGS